ncbi:MAG: hypothetical protein WBS24_10840 [Terriglobales bacterium]
MATISRLLRRVRRRSFLFDARTTILVAAVTATPLVLFAAQHEAIAIKASSVSKQVVLVDGEVGGKSVQLECFLSVAHCKVPKEGDYVLIRFPEGEGPYMDCLNVHLYEKSNRLRGQKIGDYCLLGE